MNKMTSLHTSARLPQHQDTAAAMKICNFCGNAVERFLPYGEASKSRSPLMALLETVGSDIENYLCPVCNANDRDRHLKMYFEATGILENRKKLRVLHFAAEQSLIKYLRRFDIEVHVCADLFPRSRTFEKINLQAIPYDDESFDLVIANHVLEHVDDLNAALMQINRVLKPDGLAILQTPYSRRLDHRFEDRGIDSAELRHLFYGQSDHARLFGCDIVEEFSRFLTPRTHLHSDFFDKHISVKHGVNTHEPFLLFGKKPAASLAPPTLRPMADRSKFAGAAPLVSIACITYNHGPYIAAALESFVRQESDFRFEIVIGEDCSTDDTLDIVMRYEQSYPELIKVLRADSNMGARKNVIRTLQHCEGKYIALCEGDDYWTDLRKLQKQADFLEQNPGYSMVYSSVNAHQNGKIDYAYRGGEKRDLRGGELMVTQSINTPTAMMRNIIEYLPIEFLVSGTGDMFLWSLLGQIGDGKYLDTVLPSIYRMHAGGIHSLKSESVQRRSRVHTCFALAIYYQRNDFPDVVTELMKKIRADLAFIRRHEKFATLEDFMVFVKGDMARKAEGEMDLDLSSLEGMVRAEHARHP